MLVLVGDLALLGGVLLGLGIYWLGLTGGPLRRWMVGGEEHREATLLLGVLTAGLGGLCGYTLILIGQWRSGRGFPGKSGGRRLAAVSLVFFLLAASLLTLAGLLDEGRTYLRLGQGPEILGKISWGAPPGTLLAMGAALLVGRFLLSNLFLRTVAASFRDRRRTQRVDAYLVLVCLLIGATGGAVTCAGHLVNPTVLFLGIAVGWLTCFIGHLYLVDGARTCIAEGLRQPGHGAGGESLSVFACIPQRLSGMHRILRARSR
jgi:hypothetical protein